MNQAIRQALERQVNGGICGASIRPQSMSPDEIDEKVGLAASRALEALGGLTYAQAQQAISAMHEAITSQAVLPPAR